MSLKAGVSAGRVVNGLLVEPELRSRPTRRHTQVQARCTLPGPMGHTHSLWFKSTLLLFLRLLLSTKKDGLPNLFFFFFFFQEKQATENGILQIYKHGENGQNALRRRGSVKNSLCSS